MFYLRCLYTVIFIMPMLLLCPAMMSIAGMKWKNNYFLANAYSSKILFWCIKIEVSVLALWFILYLAFQIYEESQSGSNTS